MSVLNAFSTPDQANERISAFSPQSIPFSKQLEPEQQGASWYQGIGTGVVGIASHSWDLAAVGATMFAQESEVMRAIDYMSSVDVAGWLEETKQSRLQKLRDSRPDPRTMGVIAQGIQQMGTVVAAGIGGFAAGGPLGSATSIAAVTGLDKYWELRDQTGSHETALKGAAIEAVVMGVSAALAPYYGATLLKQVASGVGMTVGAGMIERGGIGAVLEADGYSEVAKHYQVLDAQASTIDAILALGFVGFGRYAKGKQARIPQEMLDDSMAGNLGIQERTIVGDIPTTSSALDYETARSLAFTEDLMNGTPIRDIPSQPAHPDTIPNPKLEEEIAVVGKIMNDMPVDESGTMFSKVISQAAIADSAFRAADSAVMAIEAKPIDVLPVEKVGDGEPAAKAVDAEAMKAEAQKAADSIASEDITRAISTRTADEMPDVIVRADQDGNNKMTMKQVLEESEANYREDSIQASLHNVAVKCLIGFGR